MSIHIRFVCQLGKTMTNKRQVMMEENRLRLIEAGRKAFTAQGYAAASMDELTASVGLTRGALYHNFGDKKGLLAAVVHQIDSAMAQKAQQIGARKADPWEALLAEGAAYIEMALDAEVQRIVLLDGPAVLGDPSRWPSQDSCLQSTQRALKQLIAEERIKKVDPEAAARLLNGAALNAALWVAASDDPGKTLPNVIEAFNALAAGLLIARCAQ
jgi:AcrR family transcriptional regulator